MRVRFQSRVAASLATVALCLLLAGCAQTGAPLPPSLELPRPPTDLRASRKGDRVTLTWQEPTLTTDRQSVRYLGPTLVCRSLDPNITTCDNLSATLPPPPALPVQRRSRKNPAQKPNLPHPAPQAYVDNLPASLLQPDSTAEVTYAIEILNRNSRGAGLSNRVRVPAVVTPPPPSDLAAQLTGDGVVLTWTSTGESRHSPAIQHRYRIYRIAENSENNTPSGKNSTKDVIAGEIPFGDAGPVHFTDSGLEWEKTYLYRITTVTFIKRTDSEDQVEGDDTPAVRVVAHDIFPPAIPGGLQAAYSGEGQKPFIDLIWAPVTSADLAGYNVYRSENASHETRIKLNSELVKSPAYRDFAVVSGKTYTYSVSAVDVRGNESQRSTETSEATP
ncbi:MAG: hypothetical protein WAK29_08005 [Terriglobales bacterium]